MEVNRDTNITLTVEDIEDAIREYISNKNILRDTEEVGRIQFNIHTRTRGEDMFHPGYEKLVLTGCKVIIVN